MGWESGWAFIADLYLPILAVCFGVSLRRVYLKEGKAAAKKPLQAFLWSLVVVYGGMLVDLKFGIWPHIGGDYSTHTALSWAFLAYWLVCSSNVWIKALSVASLCWYGELMFRLHYHSYFDVISTSLAILPFLIFLYRKHNAL